MIRSTALLASVVLVLSACGAPQTTATVFQPAPGGGFGGMVTQQIPTAPNIQPPQQQTTVFSVAPRNAPRGPVVDNFARDFLDGLQAQSIAERREYCGYFFIDQNGRLQGTTPRRGTFASCEMPEPRAGQGIIASYHTHGAYGEEYDNEVPSAVDLLSDFDYGIDGYVATPGGRIWHVDFQSRSTRQVCSLRCVTSDPGFRPIDEAGISQIFSVQALQQRNASF